LICPKGSFPARELDPEAGRWRWLNLDIQTALCLMNIPFALCLTPQEYERAVHSLRLDDSLLTMLAQLTRDVSFWRRHGDGMVVRVERASTCRRSSIGTRSSASTPTSACASWPERSGARPAPP